MEYQTAFYQELAEVKDLILKMGVLVQELINKSVDSLKNRDRDLAKQVIKKDLAVDRLELEIDEKCINLIALRQPKAFDLRFITTGMRLVTDLERIGDLAEDIAERAIEVSDQPLLKPLIDIPKMAKLAEEAVKLGLDAFINSDAEKTKEIWAIEKQVNKLRDLVHDELIEIMGKDSSTVAKGIPLLLVSRHLERISDHATNIAEDVVYMVEAKVVKHPATQEK
ncbi:phosphate transport system regulatory protein PhoU [Candidatus Saganbacteria bacterium CG08_land_8_20_14_0_20_45_16]|uniref:Phosphate-specific transport system accessory protein PhoU n=1 Tax=Candidatus Saganbacteria bacterium CG08_land_8_20_14_0_20_45_16 TaxID=2014293 RepID=A0A2H0XXZ2_UNCSA|nr:MAG: phosphate transport system regulatory protein PhoU [Candidatus Saganbacteria bacterium CG08_land_8_20_14_0_20_45_16]